MTAASRLHRLALRAYPRAFRAQFGGELDGLSPARRGAARVRAAPGRVLFASFLVAAAIASGLAERFRRPLDPRPRSLLMRVDPLTADIRLALRQFARAPLF